MANFSVNANTPGVKLSVRNEPASAVQSSNVLTMLLVAMDPTAMQDTLDGYVVGDANTNKSKVVYTSPVAVKADEYVGQYVYSSVNDEARKITKNTAAAAAAAITLDVEKPFTAAPTSGDNINVRRWEKLYVPKLYSNPQKAYADYLEVNADGTYNFTANQENVRYILQSHKDNGAGPFILMPVESSANEAALVGNLGDTDNTDFVAAFRILQRKPDLVCLSHCDAFPVDISAANWATIVTAWQTFVTNQGSDATVDSSLPQMQLVADTPTSVYTSAQTFRTTTLNSTSKRTSLVHGKYMVAGINAGTRQVVGPAPAVCAMVNRVSVSSPNGTAHAMAGPSVGQLVDALDVVENISDSELLALTTDGVNGVVSRPGQGVYVSEQFTQAKSSTTAGNTVKENLHAQVTINRIFNSLQPVLVQSVKEPNNSTSRGIILSQINNFMDGQLNAGLVSSYSASDTTDANDIASKTAEFELLVNIPDYMSFISINLTAKLS